MNTEVMWFTNGNSFILNGQRYAGATGVSNAEIIWGGATLSKNVSSEN